MELDTAFFKCMNNVVIMLSASAVIVTAVLVV